MQRLLVVNEPVGLRSPAKYRAITIVIMNGTSPALALFINEETPIDGGSEKRIGRTEENMMSMKMLGLRCGMGPMLLSTMLGLFGCAAADSDNADADESVVVTASSDSEKTDSSKQALTINMNCATPIYGLPQPVCKPDLHFTQTVTTIYAPGNPENIAPGRYISFGFTNESDKPTPAFKAHVKDQYGNIVRTVDFPAFAPHQSGSVQDVAPYECGWSRTAVLDTTNAVDEYSESNNTTTLSYACPRMTVLGL